MIEPTEQSTGTMDIFITCEQIVRNDDPRYLSFGIGFDGSPADYSVSGLFAVVPDDVINGAANTNLVDRPVFLARRREDGMSGLEQILALRDEDLDERNLSRNGDITVDNAVDIWTSATLRSACANERRPLAFLSIGTHRKIGTAARLYVNRTVPPKFALERIRQAAAYMISREQESGKLK